MSAFGDAQGDSLRDALFDLERANTRERESRQEAEILLEGLRVLSDYDRRDVLFARLLEILQVGIGFEEAFILGAESWTRMRVVATTAYRFAQVEWVGGSFTQRLLFGRPIAVFDVNAIAEWTRLSAEVRAGVSSALHVLLRDEPAPAILVCTHSERGFFTAPQLRLAQRFAPLAVGGLRNVDSLQRMERLNARLQKEISERKQAEAVAARSLERIAHSSKMAALGEMAGGMAHEINNPLAIISALSSQLSELISDPTVEDAELRDIAQEIESTTLRIARIVSGLRSFSREGAQDPFVLTPLRRLVDDTLVLCARRMVYAEISLQVEDVDPGLYVECRPTQLSQVLLNLLNNSYDAVSGLAERWIRLECRAQGDRIEIAVSDSGGGIPDAVVQRMFEPFFTTKAVGQGTGLGLSISAGLVEIHRGRLTYDASAPHTRFVLTLPQARARAAVRTVCP